MVHAARYHLRHAAERFRAGRNHRTSEGGLARGHRVVVARRGRQSHAIAGRAAGGWGAEADQEHCRRVLAPEGAISAKRDAATADRAAATTGVYRARKAWVTGKVGNDRGTRRCLGVDPVRPLTVPTPEAVPPPVPSSPRSRIAPGAAPAISGDSCHRFIRSAAPAPSVVG